MYQSNNDKYQNNNLHRINPPMGFLDAEPSFLRHLSTRAQMTTEHPESMFSILKQYFHN